MTATAFSTARSTLSRTAPQGLEGVVYRLGLTLVSWSHGRQARRLADRPDHASQLRRLEHAALLEARQRETDRMRMLAIH